MHLAAHVSNGLKTRIHPAAGRYSRRKGCPSRGGNLSPLLANVYLNEFDQKFLKRGVPYIRYADDIVLLAKSNLNAITDFPIINSTIFSLL